MRAGAFLFLRIAAASVAGTILAPGGAAAQFVAPPAPPPVYAGETANGVGSQFELLFWQSVAGSEDRNQYEAYLAQYPRGTFSGLARAKIALLDRAGRTAAAPLPSVAIPAPAASPPPASPPPAMVTEAPPPATGAAPEGTLTLAQQLRELGRSQMLAASRNSAAAPAPEPAAAPAPVAFVAPAPAPAPAPAAAPVAATAPMQPRAGLLPDRPQLNRLPAVGMPRRFCSAEERNTFYDEVYSPAKDLALQNNRTTVAHMRRLQGIYDTMRANGDVEAVNLLSAESEDYQAVARKAYDDSVTYNALFDRLMAVPVGKCTGGA